MSDGTKADDIALALEEAIVSGEIPPGSTLRQEHLSEQFQVSRTPVREALRRLAALGLVSFEPNRGVRVRMLSRDEIREAFMVRAELESLATEIATPKMTEDDLAELEHFLTEAHLDVVGVFGYSDEDGTEAAELDGKIDPDEVNARVARVSSLVEELMSQRAEERIGTRVEVLIDEIGDDGVIGRAAHQGPEVDGTTSLVGAVDGVARGVIVPAFVVAAEGIDLIAETAAR